MTNPKQLSDTVLIHLWNYQNYLRSEIGMIRAQNKQSDDYFEEQQANKYHDHLKEAFVSVANILEGYKPHAESDSLR